MERVMTLVDAEKAVDRIKALAGDPEAAHGAEDDLRRAVLRAVADGHPQARQLAEISLMTDAISFPRGCA